MPLIDNHFSAEGPSFPSGIRILATLIVTAMLLWFYLAFDRLLVAGLKTSSWLLIAVALAIVLSCYFNIIYGRTKITATHVQQSWLWTKKVALVDISQAKLIDIPALRWVFAPRLVLRLHGGGFRTIHAADQAVLDCIRKLGRCGFQP